MNAGIDGADAAAFGPALSVYKRMSDVTDRTEYDPGFSSMTEDSINDGELLWNVRLSGSANNG